jgi:hypothetical protein
MLVPCFQIQIHFLFHIQYLKNETKCTKNGINVIMVPSLFSHLTVKQGSGIRPTVHPKADNGIVLKDI